MCVSHQDKVAHFALTQFAAPLSRCTFWSFAIDLLSSFGSDKTQIDPWQQQPGFGERVVYLMYEREEEKTNKSRNSKEGC